MKTFCVGNVNPGTVRAEFMFSMFGLMQDPVNELFNTRYTQFINKESGPYLDVARNFVVEAFLKLDSEVLLFIDSDMKFDPDSAHDIVSGVSEETPVCGGWYTNLFPEIGMGAVAFNWHDVDDTKKILPITTSEFQANGELEEVDCVGTGFMAIHRSILESMPKFFDYPTPWFAELGMYGTQMGEDVTFCKRVQSLGFPVLIDWGVTVDHIKPILLTTETQITERLT